MKVAVAVAVALSVIIGCASSIVSVPNVVGMSLEDATSELAARGLEVDTVIDYEETDAVPFVFAQLPEAGKRVLRWERLTLVMARECLRCKY